jgi:hypothetical protein
LPRGKKPARRAAPSQTVQITKFADRVEQACPAWLDAFEERQAVLIERFHERDDEGNYKASPEQQASIHRVLTIAESSLMRFACVREQVAKEKGVSQYMEREGQTHNHLTLNFAPGMTPEQRAYAERLYLASMSGKEVEAPPVLTLPAAAQVRETA